MSGVKNIDRTLVHYLRGPEMKVPVEDLKSIVKIGNAFWADPVQSNQVMSEVMSGASLASLSPQQVIERAASGLLSRVREDGMAGNLKKNLDTANQEFLPFFRLFPEQRFLIVALHSRRWSYEKLARVLNEPVEIVEALSWKARIDLGALIQNDFIQNIYPIGTKQVGHNCPEYDFQRPWTQRFLDEEIKSKREQTFLQNHMMGCESCRTSMVRCRELYYAVEEAIPEIEYLNEQAIVLNRICVQSDLYRNPMDQTFIGSLRIFFGRKDIQWITIGGLITLILFAMTF
jgi:hypothetical protein